MPITTEPTTNPGVTTNTAVGPNPADITPVENRHDDRLIEVERRLQEAYERIERGATLIESALKKA